MSTLVDRLKRSWNVFLGRDPTIIPYVSSIGGYSGSFRPDRIRLSTNNLRTIVASIYNQIAVDVSLINILHVRLDENGNFKEIINDSLNRALTVDPNLDQTPRGLIRDLVISMFDEGVVALVATDMDKDPKNTDSFNVEKMRVGQIVEWFPQHVRVRVYNELTGYKEEIVLEKRITPIIENPFYSIMNEPNSTAQRLLRVLNQIDQKNDEVVSGKLDLIIQFPFLTKHQSKQELAQKRRKELEEQLNNARYGVGYIDGTEKIIQLNRSLENNLWDQAQELTNQLYNQLGFNKAIFDGTADEQTMLNYQNRTLEPVLCEITEQMQKCWISRTAETQGQAIRFYKDPFKLVPVAQVADISDKFTRNEIMSSNEMRAKIGLLPSKDPKADELRNANLNHPDETVEVKKVEEEVVKEDE